MKSKILTDCDETVDTNSYIFCKSVDGTTKNENIDTNKDGECRNFKYANNTQSVIETKNEIDKEDCNCFTIYNKIPSIVPQPKQLRSSMAFTYLDELCVEFDPFSDDMSLLFQSQVEESNQRDSIIRKNSAMLEELSALINNTKIMIIQVNETLDYAQSFYRQASIVVDAVEQENDSRYYNSPLDRPRAAIYNQALYVFNTFSVMSSSLQEIFDILNNQDRPDDPLYQILQILSEHIRCLRLIECQIPVMTTDLQLQDGVVARCFGKYYTESNRTL